MIPRSKIYKLLRRLHWLRARDPINEELRGWNWDKPPLRPTAYLGLGISEITSRFCSTKRDIWLRRIINAKPSITEPLRKGYIVHKVFHIAAQDVMKGLAMEKEPWDIYEYLCANAIKRLRSIGITEKWSIKLYKMLILKWLAEATEEIPPILLTEYIVDGTLLGLSRYLRIDALADGGLILELKYGNWRDEYRATLAGYAMALESYLEIPIDYGVIVLINDLENNIPSVKAEPIYIDTSARMEFIEMRDEVIDILISDKEPPRSTSCSKTCPFKEVCYK